MNESRPRSYPLSLQVSGVNGFSHREQLRVGGQCRYVYSCAIICLDHGRVHAIAYAVQTGLVAARPGQASANRRAGAYDWQMITEVIW